MSEPSCETGELIAVKMRNRRYGLIWVVGEAGEGELCRVVGLEWFGKEPPTEEEAEAAELMHLSHRWYDDLPFAARLIRSTKPPMVSCGHCEVLPEWLDFDFVSQQTNWKAIAATLYREYRWREDPKYRAQVEALPQVGDTHAFEMLPEAGGWGAGRVIVSTGSITADQYAIRRTIFAAPARWESKPTLADVERAVTGAEHPRFGEIATTDDLPPTFELLGNFLPTEAELAIAHGKGWGLWTAVQHGATHHWRLENDEAYATDIRNRRYGATFAVPLTDGRFDLFANFRTKHGHSLGLHLPARLDALPTDDELPSLLDGAEPLWVDVFAPVPSTLVYIGNAHQALDRVRRNSEHTELHSWAPFFEAHRYDSIDDWPRAAPEAAAAPTLDELASRSFFDAWKVHVDAKDLKESRQIVKALHRALAKGDDPEAAIQSAVEAFNAIDHVSETVEREAIVDALWLHGRAGGIDDPLPLIDEHRDW